MFMVGGGETAVLAAQRAACAGGAHEEEVALMEGNARRLTVPKAAAPIRVLFGIAKSVVTDGGSEGAPRTPEPETESSGIRIVDRGMQQRETLVLSNGAREEGQEERDAKSPSFSAARKLKLTTESGNASIGEGVLNDGQRQQLPSSQFEGEDDSHVGDRRGSSVDTLASLSSPTHDGSPSGSISNCPCSAFLDGVEVSLECAALPGSTIVAAAADSSVGEELPPLGRARQEDGGDERVNGPASATAAYSPISKSPDSAFASVGEDPNTADSQRPFARGSDKACIVDGRATTEAGERAVAGGKVGTRGEGSGGSAEDSSRQIDLPSPGAVPAVKVEAGSGSVGKKDRSFSGVRSGGAWQEEDTARRAATGLGSRSEHAIGGDSAEGKSSAGKYHGRGDTGDGGRAKDSSWMNNGAEPAPARGCSEPLSFFGTGSGCGDHGVHKRTSSHDLDVRNRRLGSSFHEEGDAAVTGESKMRGDWGTDTAELRKQVEALLSRVDLLESRRALEAKTERRHVRDGSESDHRQHLSPPLLLTPPPRLSRTGVPSGDRGAMGVSTTPFTGLDVLFRTPRPQEMEPHAPPTPSRGQTQWAPPLMGPRSPRRSFLTWSAGEGEDSIAARGGRIPPVENRPDSPPFWRLSNGLSNGSLREEGVADNVPGKAGPSGFPRRPRFATEGISRERAGAAGRGGGSPSAEGRRERGLFPRSGDYARQESYRERSPSPSVHSPLLGGRLKEGSPSRRSRLERRGNDDALAATESPSRRSSPGSPARDRDASGASGNGGWGCGGIGSGGGPISLLGYMRVEIFGAEDHGVVDSQANRTVKNVLTVPRQLEKLLLFGMLVCLDTFLYVTTFLPIRIVIGLVSALSSLVTRRIRPRVNRPLLYDWMRGATIAAALCSLQFLEMSRVYHYIRGQAMVKLYVLIAMVEIFDKLMCSFGQDALDSLYLSTVHKRKRRVLVHFVVVCVTACLHSLLLFVHVTTLTVAVNSEDQALLTLLISNNFAEIKSSVFKKFDKQNLFQLSCHDVVERFKLALFLAMIVLLNVCQGGLEDPLGQFMTIFVMVFGGEVLADWIKHGFIIKFNQLTPSIYDEYSTILARDVAAIRKADGSTLDHTHFVARRLAFATVPLNCVMIRFIQMAIPKLMQQLPDAPPSALWLMACLFYLIALGLKVLTGICLMAQSCTLHPDAVISSTAAATWLRSPVQGGHHKTRRELSLDKLSTIERFTLWKGRIV